MDTARQNRFAELWRKYFPGAELPMGFFYTEDPGGAEAPSEHRCFIAQLTAVRKGRSVCFDADTVVCPVGKRYMGFSQTLMPGFEYFLSCGIPGKLEGERYKKSPEIVAEVMKNLPEFEAPTKYIVFKRWDQLGPNDEPEVVIFYAKPDILSGLFTLAGYDETDINAVIAPFCAGCGAIVQKPYSEGRSEHPRAVIGMFDVSARPWVPPEVISFTAPMEKFDRMIDNMDDSFLITESWAKVRDRL